MCSCTEKYPTNFKKDLPFGFQYNMSVAKFGSVIDSLSNAGVIEKSRIDSNKFYYKILYKNEETELSITPFFHNDALYKIDVRKANGSMWEENEKKGYLKAIQFLKSQEINLVSYERAHEPYSNKYDYEYKKEPYEITLYSKNMIIIFCDQQTQQIIDEKEKQMFGTIKKDGGEFCKSIMDVSSGIYKATITDAGFLVIGVRPIGKPNFDYLAQSYFEQATDKGLRIKGCLVVDIDNSTWKNGAVIGERIGEYYK